MCPKLSSISSFDYHMLRVSMSVWLARKSSVTTKHVNHPQHKSPTVMKGCHIKCCSSWMAETKTSVSAVCRGEYSKRNGVDRGEK